MKAEQIVATVIFMVALALYGSLPYVSGVVTMVALLIALGSDDDDDDDDKPPRHPRYSPNQPKAT